MKSLSQQLKSLTIAETVFAAPIIFAYVIGSFPVLIPILLFRWLARPTHPVSDEPSLLAVGQAA